MNIDEYIRFEVLNKQFTIPPDTYSYSDVVRVSVLNEKAKYKEKGIPFTAILPSGPLPSGIQQNPYLFIGVKIVLKDETVLAIYVSKKKALLNSDMYLSDLKETKSILLKIQERIG